MKKKEIKAIIFDVGGVLYLSKSPEYLFMQKALKLSSKDYKNKIANPKIQTSKGKISEKEAFKRMSKSTGVPVKQIKDIFIREYNKRFYLNKKLIRLIKKLKKTYKISILSNLFSLSYKIFIHRRLLSHFVVPVYSHKVNSRKPSLKIYKIILKKLKIPANQLIFVDDKERNLIPAKKLGIKTILFKNNKQLTKDLKKLGVKI